MFVHFFFMTNGTIKLKTVENGRLYAQRSITQRIAITKITQRSDFDELLPQN